MSFVLLIVNRLASLALPYSSQLLFDRVIARRDFKFLNVLVVAIILATIMQALSSLVLNRLMLKAGQKAIAELRLQVQGHVIRLSVRYFDSTRTGSLVSRIMTDVEGVWNLIGTGLLELVGAVLTAAIIIVFMVRIDYLMSIIALSCFSVVGLVLKSAFQRVRPIFKERGEVNAQVTGRLTESLGGIRVIKSYTAEAYEQGVFASGVERILQNMNKTLNATTRVGFLSTLLTGLLAVIIMRVGTMEVMSGRMTGGGLFQYMMFMGFLAAPVVQLVNVGPRMTEAIAGLDRTREVLNEITEDEDPQRTVHQENIKGELTFEHVDFAYETNKPVLEDISFTAPAGTVTALVGSSGSGKSTIIGLAAAFYKPTNGRILIDGQDLSAVRLGSYRCNLGIVLQDSFLFDGTIRENVAFARPHASEDEILQACRLAHVDEFARGFTYGYDTIIGERGVKLSGGQRQRLSIARALLANPRILILDEATSNLDSESEAYIQQGLECLMQARTTFVIAHRLSTICKADQILVVEAGRIVERGTHTSLLAARGRYYELYIRQHGAGPTLWLPADETKVIGAGNF